MAYNVVSQPMPMFYDTDGSPLEAGYLYFGVSSLNPESNPINVFWDTDLTQPAAQPIRTINGYPSNNGTPSRLYTSIIDSGYSLIVKNRKNLFIYSKLVADFVITDITVGVTASQVAIDAANAHADALTSGINATVSTNQANLAIDAANSATNSAQVAAACTNIEWAGFSISDGDLIVTYANGATSIPSLVNGEFIITY
jgi:hypothetical protein